MVGGSRRNIPWLRVVLCGVPADLALAIGVVVMLVSGHKAWGGARGAIGSTWAVSDIVS
jgi:hypothetical protein